MNKKFEFLIGMMEELIECVKGNEELEEKIYDIIHEIEEVNVSIYEELEEKSNKIEELEEFIDYLKYEKNRF